MDEDELIKTPGIREIIADIRAAGKGPHFDRAEALIRSLDGEIPLVPPADVLILP